VNKLKIFWVDVETSGLDYKKNGIIQLACIIDIDGEVVDKINTGIRPDNQLVIEKEALEISGTSSSDINSYPSEKKVYYILHETLDMYVDKFNKRDKFWFGAYNYRFDMNFLQEFWERNKSSKEYFGSYIARQHYLDPMGLVNVLVATGVVPKPKNMTLEMTSRHFGVEPEGDLHDAFTDIQLCRALYYELINPEAEWRK